MLLKANIVKPGERGLSNSQGQSAAEADLEAALLSHALLAISTCYYFVLKHHILTLFSPCHAPVLYLFSTFVLT